MSRWTNKSQDPILILRDAKLAANMPERANWKPKVYVVPESGTGIQVAQYAIGKRGSFFPNAARVFAAVGEQNEFKGQKTLKPLLMCYDLDSLPWDRACSYLFGLVPGQNEAKFDKSLVEFCEQFQSSALPVSNMVLNADELKEAGQAPMMWKLLNKAAAHSPEVAQLLAAMGENTRADEFRALGTALKKTGHRIMCALRAGNPYALVWDGGLTVGPVDRVAKATMGANWRPDLTERCRAIAYDAVRSETGQRTGHTFADFLDDVVQAFRDRQVPMPNKCAKESLEGFDRLVVLHPEDHKNAFTRSRVMLVTLHDHEKQVAAVLKGGSGGGGGQLDAGADKLDRSKFPSVDDTQWEAVKQFASSPVSVLTGPAGTGKTQTIRACVESLREIEPDAIVLCSSVTGLAVKRMSQLINKDLDRDDAAQTIDAENAAAVAENAVSGDAVSGDTGSPSAASAGDKRARPDSGSDATAPDAKRPATEEAESGSAGQPIEASARTGRFSLLFSTLHRVPWAVQQETRAPISDDFFTDEDVDLELSVNNQKNQALLDTLRGREVNLIVDEFSMVDVVLFGNFLRALKTLNCTVRRLLMAGDVEQLPPIGPGDVFRAAVAAACVPTTRLERVYRTESAEVLECARAVLRGEPPRSSESGAVKVITCPMDTGVYADMPEVVARENREKQDGALVQVITPLNKTRRDWALAIQKKVGFGVDPSDMHAAAGALKTTEGEIVSLRERIICIRNMYNSNLMNGTQGWLAGERDGLVLVATDYESAQNPGPHIDELMEAREDAMSDPTAGAMEPPMFMEGNPVVAVPRDDFAEGFRTAWTTTVHKIQGSETEHAIVVVPRSNWSAMNRQMLYTAITRAKKRCTIICEARDDVVKMAQRPPEARRSMLPVLVLE